MFSTCLLTRLLFRSDRAAAQLQQLRRGSRQGQQYPLWPWSKVRKDLKEYWLSCHILRVPESQLDDYLTSYSVWSGDIDRANKLAERIEAGNVWVNTHFELDPRVPFGGHKVCLIPEAYAATSTTAVPHILRLSDMLTAILGEWHWH